MSNYTDVVKQKVLRAIDEYKMLENTDEIVVGFSGGADSVCLLHILYSLKDIYGYSLKAVHINHGIRGDEAKSDEEFAKNFCFKFNIPFEVFGFECIKEAEKNKESLEECGRRLRYDSFNKVCGVNSKITTAHNANDNAETVIFNIARGTSVKGLCGIPFVRDNIIRPLLYCSRKEIENYCKENGLAFVTDSTNSSVEYSRNKIRHLILPVLEEINPSYLNCFNSLSDNAKCVSDFLNLNAEELLLNSKTDYFTYNRKILLESDKAVATQMLCSEFYEYCNLILDNKKANNLYNLLSDGGRLQIYGDIFAEVKKDYLRFFRIDNADFTDEIEILSFPFESVFSDYLISLEKITDNSKIVNHLCMGDMIDCNTLSGKLGLRTRKAGDKFTFFKRNVSKSLKKLFTEENIPIEIRDKIPVLSDDNGVVWVYGFGVTKRNCADKHSDNIILVRGKNNDR